jgi:hypothetical protein
MVIFGKYSTGCSYRCANDLVNQAGFACYEQDDCNYYGVRKRWEKMTASQLINQGVKLKLCGGGRTKLNPSQHWCYCICIGIYHYHTIDVS